MSRKAEPPPGYAIVSDVDLQAAFARDDYATIARFFRQNPAPTPAATALLVEWLGAKGRRGRPPVDDVRRDTERALIEVRVAAASDPHGRKEGRFRVAADLGCSESKITHALSPRPRGK